MTPSDLDRLRVACRRPVQRAALELLAATGGLLSQLVTLNREDLDIGAATLTLTSGWGHRRAVALPERAVESVCAYLDGRSDNHPALLVRPRGGAARMTRQLLWSHMDAVAERAGMTFATRLFRDDETRAGCPGHRRRPL